MIGNYAKPEERAVHVQYAAVDAKLQSVRFRRVLMTSMPIETQPMPSSQFLLWCCDLANLPIRFFQ